MTCIFSRISGLQQAPNKATWESFFSLPSFYISLKSTQIVLQCSVWMRKSQLTTERTERVVMDLEQWKSGLIDSTMRNFHIWISFQESVIVCPLRRLMDSSDFRKMFTSFTTLQLNHWHTIRKVKFLSRNSILTKPQHFHEFLTVRDSLARSYKFVWRIGILLLKLDSSLKTRIFF